MLRRWVALVGFGCLLVGCTAATGTGSAKSPFDYDKAKPLEAKVETPKSIPGGVELSFTIRGRSEAVPALLCLPKATSKKPPLLVLLHGLGGNKEQTKAISAMAVAAGYATVALDAPLHGERAAKDGSMMAGDLKVMRERWVDAVVDYRRTLDYLESRTDVDTTRVVLLGASMGGMMGALLFGSEERIDAAALIVAGGDFRLLAETSKHPIAPELKKAIEAVPKTDADTLLNDIDPVQWIGKGRARPLLFVNGKLDDIVPEKCALALIAAAREPKTVIWDNVGHSVSPTTMPKIYEWLLANTPKSNGGE